MSDPVKVPENSDSTADAIAALVLIVVFVAACVFWISTQ